MKLSLLIVLPLFLLAGCSNGTGGYPDAPTKQSGDQAHGNPYNEGTGHYAGYEWAERTGGDCNGNSDSFNEGCEEYYDQQGE